MKSSSKTNGRSRRVTYRHYAQILRNHKKTLSKQYKVKEIGIFGSYVRGEQKRRSDVDILVEFSEIPGLLKFIQLEDYLAGALNHRVDLVHKKALRSQLRELILNEVIYV